jgi:hypothetical protein
MKTDLLMLCRVRIVVHSELHIHRRLKRLARFKTVMHYPPLQYAESKFFGLPPPKLQKFVSVPPVTVQPDNHLQQCAKAHFTLASHGGGGGGREKPYVILAGGPGTRT